MPSFGFIFGICLAQLLWDLAPYILYMRSLFSKSISKVVLMIVALWAMFLVGKINASIPTDYVANYEIQTDYNKILWLFVEIDAATKIWNQIPQTKFS